MIKQHKATAEIIKAKANDQEAEFLTQEEYTEEHEGEAAGTDKRFEECQDNLQRVLTRHMEALPQETRASLQPLAPSRQKTELSLKPNA